MTTQASTSVRKGHLISCVDRKTLRFFEENEYVGVGVANNIPGEEPSSRQLASKLRIFWDVISDLKRVEPGDILFLHSGGEVRGPFLFTSTFREDPNIPPEISSHNLDKKTWEGNGPRFHNLGNPGYVYRASISSPAECQVNSGDIMQVFLRQAQGSFNSIPPRFRYGDTRKIVKPLLSHENQQLLNIVGSGAEVDALSASQPQGGYNRWNPIVLDLRSYGGMLAYEKTLEAWFMESMAPTGLGNSVISSFFDYDYFSNSVYTYYTNFLDVLVYTTPDDSLEPCPECSRFTHDVARDVEIIELKRGKLNAKELMKTISQLDAYLNWARKVISPVGPVKGTIVAASFPSDAMSPMASVPTNIRFLEYSPNGTNVTLTERVPKRP